MNLHKFSRLLVAIFACHSVAVSAKVTQATIKDVTKKMESLTEEITTPQVDEDNKVKSTKTKESAANALGKICNFLHSELGKPLSKATRSKEYKKRKGRGCRNVNAEFYSFVIATGDFLHAVQGHSRLFLELDQEDQTGNKEKIKADIKSPENHENENKLIKDSLVWLKDLWASRKGVTLSLEELQNYQKRSFIEQQLSFYDSTNCFDPDDDTLKINLKVVEHLTKLIQLFE